MNVTTFLFAILTELHNFRLIEPSSADYSVKESGYK